MFEILNPAYLFGIAAAAIPLIIHLSRSRRPKKMRFSTTRFFTDQFLRSYRMSRLKELLLLTCRMLLFGLFAFALAQPLFKPKNASAADSGDAARTVVLVLDNSASMGYVEDGVTLLERARKSARSVAEGLRPGDSVALVLAGRRSDGPEAPLPEPTDERGQVLQTLDRISVSSLGTDLTAALQRAETIALSATTPHKEVYVFSDLQKSGWEITDDKGRSDTSQVSFFFVSVRPRQRVRNVGVTAVQFASSRPMAGVPFTLRPRLAVQGSDAADVSVSLFVDGARVGDQRVKRLAGGRWALPRFTHTFTSGGWHSGYVEVRDQTLPQDNRRYFALEVLDKSNILAVNGASSGVPRLDELFFLKLALTVSPQPGQKGPFTVDTISPAAVAEAELAKYPLVLLANVESLSEAAVAKLEEFADKGGSVLWFLGDKVNRTFYNETLAAGNRRHGGLLPGKLVEREGDPADNKDVATISIGEGDDEALRSVTFKALWRMQVPAAAVLMKASTGAPLLAQKDYGRGRVVVFASTCDRDWTNFPIKPAFLPWVRQLVAELSQQPGGRAAFCDTGAMARLPAALLKDNAAPLVRKPDKTLGYGTLENGDKPVLLFGDTEQPGIYTLLPPEQKGILGQFAVNLESYESDLAYLDEEGVKEKMQRSLVTFVDDPEQVTEAAASARSGTRLWDWILLVVLAIALFEPWLANRISARHYGKARRVPLLPGSEGGRAPQLSAERPAAEEVRS